MRGQPAAVVKSLTNDIWVPADAEMTLEGHLDERGYVEPEGPYGEYMGQQRYVTELSCLAQSRAAGPRCSVPSDRSHRLPATLPPWRYQQRSPAGCRTMIDRRPADRGARPRHHATSAPCCAGRQACSSAGAALLGMCRPVARLPLRRCHRFSRRLWPALHRSPKPPLRTAVIWVRVEFTSARAGSSPRPSSTGVATSPRRASSARRASARRAAKRNHWFHFEITGWRAIAISRRSKGHTAENPVARPATTVRPTPLGFGASRIEAWRRLVF